MLLQARTPRRYTSLQQVSLRVSECTHGMHIVSAHAVHRLVGSETITLGCPITKVPPILVRHDASLKSWKYIPGERRGVGEWSQDSCDQFRITKMTVTSTVPVPASVHLQHRDLLVRSLQIGSKGHCLAYK